ncbi:hypothetical protein [Nocardia terpenica]|uniref:Uncharacterized protein n=1 Tax=Nocardia terpenica TaxID=455432 RepID=A0A6G9YXL1_9NOCA|nr:hypothetical protein [Nocardia terpenica]QIS17841.1 hypothetical protein F6W96_05450 [Nocardia terpenica]
MEQIAGDHTSAVRRLRYRIEEIDDEARENNSRLGVIRPDPDGPFAV